MHLIFRESRVARRLGVTRGVSCDSPFTDGDVSYKGKD